jgi:hypothetical protein
MLPWPALLVAVDAAHCLLLYSLLCDPVAILYRNNSPLGDAWTLHYPFSTCSCLDGKPHRFRSQRLFRFPYLLPIACRCLTPLCLHLCSFPSAIHFTLKMEAPRSSETLVSDCSATRHNPEVDLKSSPP